MYGEVEIGTTVRYHREQIVPVPIDSLHDLKIPPNDVLLSYLIEDLRLERHELTAMMADPEILNKRLRAVVPAGGIELPPEIRLFNDYAEDYPDKPSLLVSALAELFGVTTYSSPEQGSNQMLVALPTERKYQFPSGRDVGYKGLTVEFSANMSVFDLGFSLIEPDQIFLRDNSIIAMCALYDNLEDTEGFEQYAAGIDIESVVIGVSLAHELCEIDQVREGNLPVKRLDMELESERRAKEFLSENGFDMQGYELFHRIRGSKEGRKNISRIVLDNLGI